VLHEQYEQIERDVQAKLLELRSDLTEKMLTTIRSSKGLVVPVTRAEPRDNSDVVDLPSWPAAKAVN
jgi:hypothetical protein